jgi:putative methylase
MPSEEDRSGPYRFCSPPSPRTMRRTELVRALERVPPPVAPRAELEQVVTPAEAAADLLLAAVRVGSLPGRTVLDLGTGTGRLAIGAALLGASMVVGVEVDPALLVRARAAANAARVEVEFVEANVRAWHRPAEVVVMNPPFGAQYRHADRPFWDAALTLATHSVHAFALADSRTFIARRAVARNARILETEPTVWELPRTFPHHTRRRVRIPVDRWAIATDHRP